MGTNVSKSLCKHIHGRAVPGSKKIDDEQLIKIHYFRLQKIRIECGENNIWNLNQDTMKRRYTTNSDERMCKRTDTVTDTIFLLNDT